MKPNREESEAWFRDGEGVVIEREFAPIPERAANSEGEHGQAIRRAASIYRFGTETRNALDAAEQYLAAVEHERDVLLARLEKAEHERDRLQVLYASLRTDHTAMMRMWMEENAQRTLTHPER